MILYKGKERLVDNYLWINIFNLFKSRDIRLRALLSVMPSVRAMAL